MNEKTGRELWQELVRVTDNTGNEYVRSLRIPLFILLGGNKNVPLLRQAHQVIAGVRPFLPRMKEALPSLERGKLLVCFAHSTPSNMQNLLPVTREALRRGLLGGIISSFPRSKTRGVLHEFVGKIPILNSEELITQIGFRERGKMFSEVLTVLSGALKLASELYPAAAARCRRNFGHIIGQVITSVAMARAFEIALSAWQPSCVISTSDLWPLEYQFAHQASRKQIPSAVVQHGSINYFYWPFIADRYLLWGEQSANELVTLGAPTDRLQMCGMPASDKIFQLGSCVKPALESSARPVCLILSHTHARGLEPELYSNFGQFLVELVRTTPYVRWKVKLHPSEDKSFYEQLGAELIVNLEFYPKSTSLEQAISEAGIVTTLYSTSGQEAMMAGRPLIVPLVSQRMTEPGLLPQIKGGIQVKSPGEFRRVLELLISSAEYRSQQLELQKKALNHSFSNQGHASEAILDCLQERFVSMFSGREGDGPHPHTPALIADAQ